mmetsp:Transcript_47148/g.137107  ORF Transcript_47148/g.137107 Transcript_47148/m.137107 type:complete len:214 (+) Transcript_47148:182-823(+)
MQRWEVPRHLLACALLGDRVNEALLAVLRGGHLRALEASARARWVVRGPAAKRAQGAVLRQPLRDAVPVECMLARQLHRVLLRVQIAEADAARSAVGRATHHRQPVDEVHWQHLAVLVGGAPPQDHVEHRVLPQPPEHVRLRGAVQEDDLVADMDLLVGVRPVPLVHSALVVDALDFEGLQGASDLDAGADAVLASQRDGEAPAFAGEVAGAP